MAATRRVVIFPSDVGFEIRYNIVRWRKYLCKRLEAAGIEFVCPMGAHEPLPEQLNNKFWRIRKCNVLNVKALVKLV